MINIDAGLTLPSLRSKLHSLFDLSAAKIRSLEQSWTPAQGAPVFTIGGRYTSRGWTDSPE